MANAEILRRKVAVTTLNTNSHNVNTIRWLFFYLRKSLSKQKHIDSTQWRLLIKVKSNNMWRRFHNIRHLKQVDVISRELTWEMPHVGRAYLLMLSALIEIDEPSNTVDIVFITFTACSRFTYLDARRLLSDF